MLRQMKLQWRAEFGAVQPSALACISANVVGKSCACNAGKWRLSSAAKLEGYPPDELKDYISCGRLDGRAN